MPAALRVCSAGCGALVAKGKCTACAGERERERGTRQERGYGAPWERIRKRVIKEQQWCQRCLQKDIVVPIEEVDHIIPKVDGGTDDYSNLMGLCKSCHSRKTVTEDHGFNRR